MGREKICIEKREERIIRTKRIYMEVDSDFFQTYKNLFRYTATLRSPWSHNYLSWLIVHMNDENIVHINNETHKNYIKDISEIGEIIPAERTLKQSVNELKKANILLPLARGRFKINPVIFWKDTKNARIRNIGFLQEGGEFSLEPVTENKKIK